MFEWWRKSFFFLLLQLIIYFHWAVLLLWLVVELVDSRFCIRNMSIIVFFSLLFDVVVPLLFFLTQFSIAIDFAVSFTPFFRYSVYVSSDSVTNEFGKRKKTEQSIHNNIRAYVWSCVENSIDNEQKNISKESIEKVLVLLSLTVLMKRTALEHTHNLCK